MVNEEPELEPEEIGIGPFWHLATPKVHCTQCQVFCSPSPSTKTAKGASWIEFHALKESLSIWSLFQTGWDLFFSSLRGT